MSESAVMVSIHLGIVAGVILATVLVQDTLLLLGYFLGIGGEMAVQRHQHLYDFQKLREKMAREAEQP